MLTWLRQNQSLCSDLLGLTLHRLWTLGSCLLWCKARQGITSISSTAYNLVSVGQLLILYFGMAYNKKPCNVQREINRARVTSWPVLSPDGHSMHYLFVCKMTCACIPPSALT